MINIEILKRLFIEGRVREAVYVFAKTWKLFNPLSHFFYLIR